jgi:transposase-like protein
MIKRQRHSEEFKKKIGLELASGLSSAGEISKREGISSTTLYKWRDQTQMVLTVTDNKDYIEQQKRIKELEEIVSDQAIQIHILKKTQKIMEQLKKKERLSGTISPRTLESK